MFFSLIIPCYNEGKNLPLVMERCKVFEHRSDIEIILVDNGSTDCTPEVLKRLLPHYPNCRSVRVKSNRGYGHGIIAGLAAAEGKIVGWTHADMQTDPADVEVALSTYFNDDRNNFVKGRRVNRPFFDVVFSIGMGIFETILLKKFLWDINAQPTLFPKKFIESWQDPPEDFSLDLYVYYLAKKQNYKISRIPVLFGDRAYGLSHWNINWKEKMKFINRTISYSFELRRRL